MNAIIVVVLLLGNTVGAANTVTARAAARTLPSPSVPERSSSAAAAAADLETSLVPSSVDPKAARTVGACRGGAVAPAPAGLLQTVKVASLFSLWYALNVVYNIVNKRVLNALPLPMLVAVAQLGVGSAYALAAWHLPCGLNRPSPFAPEGGGVDAAALKALGPIGAAHGIGQVATVLSLGAGAVSFTHIVKALEPFFSAIVSAVVSGVVLRPQVYATLLPVVGGVSLAVAKERGFSMLAFVTAMGSNLAFALRAVLSKAAMAKSSGGATVSPPSLFGLVTLLSFALMLPLALLAEGGAAKGAWAAATNAATGHTTATLARAVFLSGLFHYTNNEVMYLVLGHVHPITLAVGNTLKRVVLIVASLLVFRNPMTPTAAAGSAVGIGGVLLYSLTKQHYDKVDAENEKAKGG